MKKCTIDADHSVAVFSVRHMMIAHVRGMFHKVSGCIYYDPKDIRKSTVEAVIDVRSLSTGVKKRDDHLLSGEILDAAGYPTITFRSTSVAPKGAGAAEVHGDLTLHGVTKPVMLNVEYFGPVKSPWGGEVAVGFTASTRINREDFGVNWGSDRLAEGGLMTSKEVDITIDIEADLEQ